MRSEVFTDEGADISDNHGSKYGSKYGSEYGSEYGGKYGSEYGSEYGSKYVSEYGKIYGARNRYGDIYGDISGNINGSINGNFNGNINGDKNGNINGNKNGTMYGNVFEDAESGAGSDMHALGHDYAMSGLHAGMMYDAFFDPAPAGAKTSANIRGFSFCYNPFYQGDQAEDLQALFERIIACIDYEDQELVRMTYEMFSAVQGENVHWKNVEAILRRYRDQDPAPVDPELYIRREDEDFRPSRYRELRRSDDPGESKNSSHFKNDKGYRSRRNNGNNDKCKEFEGDAGFERYERNGSKKGYGGNGRNDSKKGYGGNGRNDSKKGYGRNERNKSREDHGGNEGYDSYSGDDDFDSNGHHGGNGRCGSFASYKDSYKDSYEDLYGDPYGPYGEPMGGASRPNRKEDGRVDGGDEDLEWGRFESGPEEPPKEGFFQNLRGYLKKHSFREVLTDIDDGLILQKIHDEAAESRKDAGGEPLRRHVLEGVGDQAKEYIELVRFPFYIGKMQGKSDYILDRDTVSRNHLCICRDTHQEDCCLIIDQKSRNGTYLNGKRIRPLVKERIQEGDHIRLADAEFVFH